jgi:nucleolar protein 56
MRIREWYSYHFPELYKIVPDNYMFAKCVKYISQKGSLSEASLDDLETITLDRDKAVQIVEEAKTSMGFETSDFDMINIQMFADKVIQLAEFRKEMQEYLSEKMAAIAPNLSTVIGDSVGARLISHAGSLTNLAKYPASTVQILGAEKALFRALKNRGNTPKYGLIFHSSFISRAGTRDKGRMSRVLANKCAIASRIDCFADSTTNKYGVKLAELLEERLNFYADGTPLTKTKDALRSVAAEVGAGGKKKKKKKTDAVDMEVVASEEAAAPKKEKKKKPKAVEADD